MIDLNVKNTLFLRLLKEQTQILVKLLRTWMKCVSDDHVADNE